MDVIVKHRMLKQRGVVDDVLKHIVVNMDALHESGSRLDSCDKMSDLVIEKVLVVCFFVGFVDLFAYLKFIMNVNSKHGTHLDDTRPVLLVQ